MVDSTRRQTTKPNAWIVSPGNYGRCFVLGQRVRTPDGEGIVTGATNFVEVMLDGNEWSEDFFPFDVESVERKAQR